MEDFHSDVCSRSSWVSMSKLDSFSKHPLIQSFCVFHNVDLNRPLIDQNFYYVGLKMTSPTYSCAISNMLPSMTFIMAVLCRMEKLDLRKVRCQAKLFGTIVTVMGAMLMTFYKGSVINFFWTEQARHPNSQPTADAAALNHHDDGEFIKGSILLIIATLAWAGFFILQVITLRKYTAHLSLTTMVCFLGTLQAIVVTLAMEHRPSAWAIGWDMNLLAAAYAVKSLSLSYTVKIWVFFM